MPGIVKACRRPGGSPARPGWRLPKAFGWRPARFAMPRSPTLRVPIGPDLARQAKGRRIKIGLFRHPCQSGRSHARRESIRDPQTSGTYLTRVLPVFGEALMDATAQVQKNR